MLYVFIVVNPEKYSRFVLPESVRIVGNNE